MAELSSKVESLSKELDRRRISTSDGKSSIPGDDEHMRLLEEQVRQFQFDFESERRDRQHAQARVDDLLQQLTAANREVRIDLLSYYVQFHRDNYWRMKYPLLKRMNTRSQKSSNGR